MAYEALSTTTRRFRKGLLTFSAAFFLYNFYGYTVEKLPIGEIKYDVPDSLISTFFFIVIIYLLVSFTIYGIDDLKNPEIRPSESKALDEYTESKQRIKSKVFKALSDFISVKRDSELTSIADSILMSIEDYWVEWYNKTERDWRIDQISEIGVLIKDMGYLEDCDLNEKSLNRLLFSLGEIGLIEGWRYVEYKKTYFNHSTTRIQKTRNFLDYYFPIAVASISVLSYFISFNPKG